MKLSERSEFIMAMKCGHDEENLKAYNKRCGNHTNDVSQSKSYRCVFKFMTRSCHCSSLVPLSLLVHPHATQYDDVW